MRGDTLLLNGKWVGSGYDENGKRFEFEGEVPGCVHTDLMKSGKIYDIFYRDNVKKTFWIEKQNFIYKRKFWLDDLKENAWIEFDGLDTYCDIFLNDIKIGQSGNMHLRYEFPVDGILRVGSNYLECRFRSPIKEVEGKKRYTGCFTTERLNTRRIQCTYGWDWVERFVTMGIYRDVRLVFRKDNEIDNVYIYTQNINPYSAQISISVEIRDFKAQDDVLKMEIRNPQGKRVWFKEQKIIKNYHKDIADISDPQLWYPNGYGKQPLYSLYLCAGKCEKMIQFGIRQLVILQLTDREESGEKNKCRELQKFDHLKEKDFNDVTSGFQVLVNGTLIMCKGANWVPCEPFPSAETPLKIKTLLEYGVQAGMNMLRVWGGGIFERDEFYSECDRLGILVTQDFLMACGQYPEKEYWFIQELQKETRYAALKLRNHPCLAWWNGDNENATEGSDDRTDFPGYLAAEYGICPVLEKLDPARIFLQSSPYGGNKYCSATVGTTHNTYFLEALFRYVRESDMSDYREYFSRYLSRFNAEQPAFGLPFASSLKKFLSEEDIWGNDTEMLEFHTKNNPDLGEITLYQYCDIMTKKIFGEYQNGIDRMRKMQMFQCEWIRLSLELFRRNKWFSAGIIYWMFNDCWPAANGWSLLDYYSNPKPSYYAFKRGAKDVIASLEKKGEVYNIYICNDSLERVTGRGCLYAYNFIEDRIITKQNFSFIQAENSSSLVATYKAEKFDVVLNERVILMCDIESNLGEDRSFLIQKRYKDMGFYYEDVHIIEQNEKEIVVTADHFQPYALIDVPYLLEENCFTLKKGEVKKIRIINKL